MKMKKCRPILLVMNNKPKQIFFLFQRFNFDCYTAGSSCSDNINNIFWYLLRGPDENSQI